MQVGVDAVRGARQRDAVDQEHEEHEVGQRGCDPHHLAVDRGRGRGVRSLPRKPGVPSPNFPSPRVQAPGSIPRPGHSLEQPRTGGSPLTQVALLQK